MRIGVLAFSVALAGCPAPDPPSAPPPSTTVEIVAGADGTWVARYHDIGGVNELHFERAGNFRATAWPILTTGYAYRPDGVLIGNPAQDTVDIQLTAQVAVDPREWPPLLRFSDGGVAVFGGYLAASNAHGHRFRGVSADDYMYRGPLEPRRHGGLELIVDPALPAWMKDVAARRLPEIMAFYAAGTGLEIATGVRVMIPHAAGSELELNGATTPGSMLVAVSGDEWQQGDPWQVERFVRFLAHEAAHLWNAGVVRFEPGTPGWLHEGAAEAFADRALLGLGLIEPSRYQALLAETDARCAAGGTRESYDCGNVHATAVERTTLASGGMDLMALWGELLQAAAASGQRYDAADWCALLRRYDALVSPCRGGTDARPAAGTEY